MSEIPRQQEGETQLVSGETKEKGKFTFRDYLKPEDCADMVKVLNSVVDEGAPIYLKSKLTEEEFRSKLDIMIEQTNRKEGIVIVAEKDGHLVGWLSGIKVEEQRRKSRAEEQIGIPTAAAGFVIIAPDKRRGLGSPFMGMATRWLEKVQKEWGSKKIITATSYKNSVARKIYKKLGFVEIGPSKEQEGYVKLEKILK